MKKIVSIAFILVAVIAFNTKSFAQDGPNDQHTVNISIPEVFLVDVEPAGQNTISLAPTSPTEAGLGLDFTSCTNSTLWLNYSSVVENATTTRKVTAQITGGSVPTGVDLKVSAAAAASGSEGTVGTPAGTITLSSTAQDLITGIGSCFTGDGSSKGHNLTYSFSLQPNNYGQVYSLASAGITVTYTITN